MRCAFLLVGFVTTGCIEHEASVRVRDPNAVGLNVGGRDDHDIELPAGSGPREVTSADGKLRVTRDTDGSVVLDVPRDKAGPITVVGADGSIKTEAHLAPGVDWDATGLVLRAPHTVSYPGMRRHAPYVEMWLRTPEANVVEIERRARPSRALGGIALAVGAAFAAGAVAAFSLRDPNERAYAAVFLGTPALALLTAGVLMLVLPETVTHERPP
jgi:hypothetical protein